MPSILNNTLQWPSVSEFVQGRCGYWHKAILKSSQQLKRVVCPQQAVLDVEQRRRLEETQKVGLLDSIRQKKKSQGPRKPGQVALRILLVREITYTTGTVFVVLFQIIYVWW